MSLKYSNAFKEVDSSPRTFYEDLANAIYDESFENAPNYYGLDNPDCVQYEFPYGSNKFHRVAARIDDVILPNSRN